MTILFVKICGVTNVADALLCASEGADAIGLNFVPESPRFVDETIATSIASAVRGKTMVVGVIANLDVAEARALAARVGLDRVQLHGDEPDVDVRALAPLAYKAVRIGGRGDVEAALRYGSSPLLVDAKHGDALGGTGKTFDWSLVSALASDRRIVLAGGLTPTNVAEAVRRVRPFGVDTASGVEESPRKKSPALVHAFVQAARTTIG